LCVGIGGADVLELADRFVVPAASRVFGEILDAVRRWPEFAEEAGVPDHEVERVQGDLAAFRPS